MKSTSDFVPEAAVNSSRFRIWQALTLGILIAGYSSYYLCRSDLSVALPLIADEFACAGLDPALARVRLGTIASLGVLVYAIGKFPGDAIADYWGGRRNFLLGMGGAVLFTLWFAGGRSHDREVRKPRIHNIGKSLQPNQRTVLMTPRVPNRTRALCQISP